MKYIFLFFIFLTTTMSGQTDLEIVTQRIFDGEVARYVNEDEIADIIGLLNPNGSWPDVNYADNSITNWDPMVHLKRENKLTRAYNKPGSIYYQQQDLYNKLLLIFDYYNNANCSSDNWWFNDIGVGSKRGLSLILMKPHFPSQNILDGSSLLNYNYGMSAANKVWLCKVSLYKACSEDNDSEASTAFTELSNEILITTDDGIQPDYVFNAHGKLLYNGGYGNSYVKDQVFLYQLSEGTAYEYPAEKVAILASLMLEGDSWMGHRQFRDFNVLGREISRIEEINWSNDSYQDMSNIETPFQERFGKINNYMIGDSDYPYQGTKHFWTADFMSQHGPSYYLSARMPSNRVLGTESINDENLKGNYFSFGSTNILVNGDEYLDIMPIWDWSRIPGTTGENTQNFPPFDTIMTEKDFSGGVVNGISGFAAYDYEFDGVAAKKIYFMPGDVLFCMGTAINASKPQPILTNMNQCWSRGDIYINTGSTELFNNSSETYDNLNWVHHDRVGYYFPDNGNITLQSQVKSGNWYSINTSESNDLVTGEVFSLWMDHDLTPNDASYQYLVVPDQSPAEFQEFIRNNPIAVLSNNAEIQAVKYISEEIYGIAFYQAGSITLDFDFTLTVDQACLVLIDITGTDYKISVSNPLNTAINVNLEVSKSLDGPNATNIGLDETRLLFVLPDGEQAGSTVSYDYYLADDPGIPEQTLEAEDAVVQQGAEDNTYAGFTGIGYVDYQNEIGSSVEFTLNMDESSYKLIGFRYANGSENNNSAEIKVNGEVINSALSFNPTGEWTDWRYQTIQINLKPGNNVIKATSTTNDGGPNLDHLAVLPEPVSWVSHSDFSGVHHLADTVYCMVTTEFDLIPTKNNINGLIGYTDENISINGFDSLAVLIRMNSAGQFDVLNGNDYEADAILNYTASTNYHVKVEANISTNIYSVWINAEGQQPVQIAQEYSFNSAGPQVSKLNKICLKSGNYLDFLVQNHTVCMCSSGMDNNTMFPSLSYCQDETNPVAEITGATGGIFTSTTGLAIDSLTGEIHLSESIAGTYSISYSTPGVCTKISLDTVIIYIAEDATFIYASSTYCQDETNPVAEILGTTGGTFNGDAGLVLDSTTGEVNLIESSSGTYTINYTTGGACPSSSTNEITINALEDATFIYASSTYCQDEINPVAEILGTTGGTFNGDAGLVIDGTTGEVNLIESGTGTYTINYTTGGACSASSTNEITINAVADATFIYASSTYCQDETNPVAEILGTTGGTFNGDAGLVIDGTTGEVNLIESGAGTYMINYTTGGACPSSSTNEITINAVADATFIYASSTYCQDEINPVAEILGTTGGIFSSEAGLTIDNLTGEINLNESSAGTYTVFYITGGACPASSTNEITINAAGDATFMYPFSTYCQDEPNPIAEISGTSGGTFTGTSGIIIDAITGEINLSESNTGTYTVFYITGGACPASSINVITINAVEDATFTYSSSSYCQDESNPIAEILSTVGGVFSSTSGLVIDGATGEINLIESSVGTYTVNYTTGGACPSSSTNEITINAVEDATFTYSSSSYCQDESNPVVEILGTFGGVFSSTSGLVVDSATGEINLGESSVGTYTVNYTTGGVCPSSSANEITINVLENATFMYPSTTFCQDESNPLAEILGTVGGVFTSDAGLVIDDTTGEINLSESSIGIYIVTYTTSGDCPGEATVEVTIDICSGIVTNVSGNVKIYPIPASEYLTVEAKDLKVKELRIVNLLGITVVSQTIQEPLTSIDLEHIMQGIYFVQLFDNSGKLLHIQKVCVNSL